MLSRALSREHVPTQYYYFSCNHHSCNFGRKPAALYRFEIISVVTLRLYTRFSRVREVEYVKNVFTLLKSWLVDTIYFPWFTKKPIMRPLSDQVANILSSRRKHNQNQFSWDDFWNLILYMIPSLTWTIE